MKINYLRQHGRVAHIRIYYAAQGANNTYVLSIYILNRYTVDLQQQYTTWQETTTEYDKCRIYRTESTDETPSHTRPNGTIQQHVRFFFIMDIETRRTHGD